MKDNALLLPVNLTKRQTAKRHSISERTICNFLKQGIPVLRVSSRKLLFPVEDVDRWMRDRFLVSGKNKVKS